MKYCLHVLAGIINFRNYCQYKGKIRTSNLHLWLCTQLQQLKFHRGHSVKMAHPLPNPFGFIVVHFTLCCKGCVHHTQPLSDLNKRWLSPRPLGKSYFKEETMREKAFVEDVVLYVFRRPPIVFHFYLCHDAYQCLCAFSGATRPRYLSPLRPVWQRCY